MSGQNVLSTYQNDKYERQFALKEHLQEEKIKHKILA